MKRNRRRRVKVNLGQLDGIVQSSRERALSEDEALTLSTAIHSMADALSPRTTEKTAEVLGQEAAAASPKEPKPPAPGHGRNGASVFTGATRVRVPHPTLKPGCACPHCDGGKVYPQNDEDRNKLTRFAGQALIQVTVYELEGLRCNLCGDTFVAPPPEGVGPGRYDETATSMVAYVKYGCGMPFNRLEGMQQRLGQPMPTSTQWELVEGGAELLKPVYEELMRLAAQGRLLHHDDTAMRVLKVERPEKDTRTGVFTTAVVAMVQDPVEPGQEMGASGPAGDDAVVAGEPEHTGEPGLVDEPLVATPDEGAAGNLPELIPAGEQPGSGDATRDPAGASGEVGAHPYGPGIDVRKIRKPGAGAQMEERRIALFFTGRQHAGENLADVLRRRAPGLKPPTVMCDALSSNTSKLSPEAMVVLAACLAHGRRNVVDVAENFPDECRHILDLLGKVYGYDAEARDLGLDPEQRLRFHKERSGPVMKELRQWIDGQFEEKLVEPNSGLGDRDRTK